MIEHAHLWLAIEELARQNRLSVSGLAVRAGFDPTTFNVSKRARGNKERWPSTGTLARILDVTGTTFTQFAELLDAVRSISAARSRTPAVLSTPAQKYVAFRKNVAFMQENGAIEQRPARPKGRKM